MRWSLGLKDGAELSTMLSTVDIVPQSEMGNRDSEILGQFDGPLEMGRQWGVCLTAQHNLTRHVQQ